MNRISVFLLAIVAFVPFSTHAQLTEAQRPVWLQGDTWEYVRENGTTSKVEVTEVTNSGYRVLMTNSKGYKGVSLYDLDINLIESSSGQVISPKAEYFRWPLRVGEPYAGGDYTYAHSRKAGVTVVGKHVIKSITSETITVKAGTFDTLKIKSEYQYRYQDGTFANEADLTRWYAPAVRRWVKNQYYDHGAANPSMSEYELVRFVPAKK